MGQNKPVAMTEINRMKQMWGWWQAKLNIARQSPWYASYLLRRFYDLMKALRPSKQLVASTVTGAALLVGSIALNPAPAHAATITVNSTADTAVGGDGQCTLREALTNANDATSTDQSGGDCLAGTGGGSDTIDLTGVSGTITLTSDLPSVNNSNEDMVLNGPGAANLTIDGVSQTFRTIYSYGVGNDITVDGLTIQGSSESGVFVREDITMTNSIISGNKFFAVGNGFGNINVVDSVLFSNNGYGIYSGGLDIVTITNANIFGNGSHGVFLRGDVRVTNSSIYENGGHGVFSSGGGDAIVTDTNVSNNGGRGVYSRNNVIVTNSTISGNGDRGVMAFNDVVVTNSTVSGNTFDGVYSYYKSVTVINSTITGNTGRGVFTMDGEKNGAAVTLKNSLIVDNNSGAGDVGCTNNSPGVTTLTTNGKNLISNSAGCAALAGEVTSVPVASIISPLANNGGSTQTHALVAGSPAIDKGNNADSPGATDQRGTGFARIANATIDIGAFEFQVSNAVGGVAELIIPHAASPVMTTGIMATLSALFMGAGAWLMRRR